jgi:ABC-2 type transport system ATP-binding protein
VDPSGLQLIDLSKCYRDTVALDGLSFDVARGQMYGFVGPNGAGKTTAMRIVLGVLAADRGEVRWRGKRIDADDRRRIGYMPEERGLYPKMRVEEQLAYFAELHGFGPETARQAAGRWLERLDVAAHAGDRVEELSLGNQQRVQLAAALVHEPDLLVLDEPFSGLDPVGVDVLSAVLLEEARTRWVPVIFSSHQLELVERLCDALAILSDGSLVAAGTVDDLRSGHHDRRWQVEVAHAREDWADGLPGVERLDGEDLYRLQGRAGPGDLLDAARAAGEVRHFAPAAPSLAELFREAVGAGR